MHCLVFLLVAILGSGICNATASTRTALAFHLQASPSSVQKLAATEGVNTENVSAPPPPPRKYVLPPPTPEDEAAEARFAQQGILMGNLKLRTNPKSVAGRGVFLETTTQSANVGDLLAFIPSHTVLTPSIAAQRYPDLKEKLDNYKDVQRLEQTGSRRPLEWPMILTAYALRAFEDDNNNDCYWADNIRSWPAGVPSITTSCVSRPPDTYTEEELESLAAQAQSSPQKIQETLRVRYEEFQQQSRLLRHILGLPRESDEEWFRDCGDVYAGILSRSISLSAFAAHLPTDKSYGHGVVPFQDMTNHHNTLNANNVGLYSVHAMRQMTPEPGLVTKHLEEAFGDNLPDPVLETDLCLVAIQPIAPGEEVLNSYTLSQEPLSEDQRVWKLLQYGFSME